MHKVAFVGSALCLVLLATVAESAGRAAWLWRGSCLDKKLAVDVTLANKTVYHGEIPLCHVVPTGPTTNDGFTFSLKTTQAVIFSGYRAMNEFVPSGAALEVSVWQAGADPDVLTLGVSVGDAKQIYVNTLLFAKPDAETTEELGTGLVITTRPIEP